MLLIELLGAALCCASVISCAVPCVSPRCRHCRVPLPRLQTAFVPGYNSFTGLGPLGYVYIPSACNATTAAAGTPACRLHVAWHGCNQYAGTIGGTYVLFAGYLEWAAQNNLVVLFPQAATTLSNPEVRPRGLRLQPHDRLNCPRAAVVLASVGVRLRFSGSLAGRAYDPTFNSFCHCPPAGLLRLVGLHQRRLRPQERRADERRVEHGADPGQRQPLSTAAAACTRDGGTHLIAPEPRNTLCSCAFPPPA